MIEADMTVMQSVLRAVANPEIDVHTYRSCMEKIGNHLASLRLKGDLKPKSAFHVVCGVEDFDHIGLSVINTLRARGHVAHFSCLWAEHQVLAQEPLLDWAPINRAYDELLSEKRYHLVVVASAVGSVTPIECMLLRIFSEDLRPEYESITIVSPFILKTAIVELKRKLAPCFDGRFIRCSFQSNAMLWPDGSPKPGLGMTGAARVGLNDVANLRRYVPSYIRSLISKPRDPGPVGSMEPGPEGGPTSEGGAEIDFSILYEHGHLIGSKVDYASKEFDNGFSGPEAGFASTDDKPRYPPIGDQRFKRSVDIPYDNMEDLEFGEAEDEDLVLDDERKFDDGAEGPTI